jgi:hypothetical protein
MSRILINQATGEPVVENLLVATSAPARLRGLLGRRSLPKDTGMLLLPCRSIHMWFMQFPIDAAFLDADRRVLKIRRNLQPWRIGRAPRHTRCVLETAAGVLDRVQPGDVLTAPEPITERSGGFDR